MTDQNNAPVGVDVDARGNILGVSSSRLLTGAARVIFNNGSHMLLQGDGFGEGGSFIEWYGPSRSSPSDCTFAEAISYKTNDGRSFFRGTINTDLGPIEQRVTSVEQQLNEDAALVAHKISALETDLASTKAALANATSLLSLKANQTELASLVARMTAAEQSIAALAAR